MTARWKASTRAWYFRWLTAQQDGNQAGVADALRAALFDSELDALIAGHERILTEARLPLTLSREQFRVELDREGEHD